ncbi:MAG: hypothetical protein KA397_02675 [Paludibacteraceae bacterium]|nr:hypothetical protein [Paludibacteraceae bacterium]
MIKLDAHNRMPWFHANGVWAIGYCFDKNNAFVEKMDLVQLFSHVQTPQDIEALLHSINGLFSVIIEKENNTLLITDKTRIYPLFYTIEGDEICVSDNPDLLLPSKPRLNKQAVNEYQHSSVTLDSATLIDGIFQVTPSSYCLFSNGKLAHKAYCSYTVQANEILHSQEHENVFENVLTQTFQRLIASACRKQLVIPLSGGFDSRLIVCMLAKLGYTNVLCYTVGRPQNPELILAQQVATTLGYPHIFISNEQTTDYVHDTTFQRYYAYSTSYSNFFWMYEYFGVKKLVEEGLVDKDAIFVPGHSGDFLAGSQLQKAGITQKSTLKEMSKAILQQKFAYGKAERSIEITKRIERFVHERKDKLPYSIFDDFDVQIKLPKNINNSARIYGFFGHEVRLPFWDNEILEFFRTLPIELKEEQTFFQNYVKNQVFAPANVNFKKELKLPLWKIKGHRIKNILKQWIPSSILHQLSSPPDYTCMKEISAPLLNDLPNKNQYGKANYNRIFLDWYLHQLLARYTKD